MRQAYFWVSPKRPPTPINFDSSDPLHVQFIQHFAFLWAQVWGIEQDVPDIDDLRKIADESDVPDFVPQEVNIVTDEKEEKPKEKEQQITNEDQQAFMEKVIEYFQSDDKIRSIHPHDFEKVQIPKITKI